MRPLAPGRSPRTLGVVDVGTNAVHLVIGRFGPDGRFRAILQRHHPTRLGDEGLADGRLRAAAVRRTWNVLARYARFLTRYRVARIEAVATSAVREAANGRAVVARVRRRLGIPLRILGGREEARLIFLGVTHPRRRRGPTLVIAVGGGSAQVAVGTGGRCRYAASRPLGGSRLAQQFLRRDPPKPAEVAALEAYARRIWRPIGRAVRRHRWTQAVGSSAAIAQVVAAARAVRPGRTGGARGPTTVTRAALRRLTRWLAEHTADDRRALAGVDSRRQALLLPAAVILLTWMDTCGVSRIRYAPGSLREGLVVARRRYDPGHTNRGTTLVS